MPIPIDHIHSSPDFATQDPISWPSQSTNLGPINCALALLAESSLIGSVFWGNGLACFLDQHAIIPSKEFVTRQPWTRHKTGPDGSCWLPSVTLYIVFQTSSSVPSKSVNTSVQPRTSVGVIAGLISTFKRFQCSVPLLQESNSTRFEEALGRDPFAVVEYKVKPLEVTWPSNRKDLSTEASLSSHSLVEIEKEDLI